MARQNRSEGWILTFADLMTLLFCFFVLLTTLSTQPKNCKGLEKYMKESRSRFVNYELRSTKLSCIVSLPQDFLFKSGDAELKQEAFKALAPFFRKIRELPEHKQDLMVVEGHTDNVPIRTKKFRNNWELSSARATNIATMLIEKLDYQPESLSVNGFADTRPKISYKDSTG
ncbi:MAG: OmpA family protein, partial [SAR324 cluster bacterium]|nr:OmpA family protein [SAR324 cluster bacterium]